MSKFKASLFAQDIAEGGRLHQRFLENPEKVIREENLPGVFNQNAFDLVLRVTIVVLAITMVVAVVWIFLPGKTNGIPTFISSTASTALGALLGLLIPTKK